MPNVKKNDGQIHTKHTADQTIYKKRTFFLLFRAVKCKNFLEGQANAEKIKKLMDFSLRPLDFFERGRVQTIYKKGERSLFFVSLSSLFPVGAVGYNKKCERRVNTIRKSIFLTPSTSWWWSLLPLNLLEGQIKNKFNRKQTK